MLNKMYRIGIDLGGTNIKVGIVNGENKIIATAKRKTLAQRPWQEIAQDIALCVKDAVAEAETDLSQCEKIGIGCPGTTNAETGVVVYANNFNGWVNIPLGEYLQNELKLPVSLSNDANCAALGEYVAGAAKNYKSTVLITLGTGVGGGVVFDGKIFEGGNPGGAELGHCIIIADGEQCTCGAKGCWEAYSSATALIREAKAKATQCPESLLCRLCEGDLENMNGIIPFKAARENDTAALEVIDQYIKWLGIGLVNMANVFRPDVILISGGICGEGTYLTDPLNTYVKKYSYGSAYTPVPQVITATLGNDAGIIGAAAL